jgi:hypothetical protein
MRRIILLYIGLHIVQVVDNACRYLGAIIRKEIHYYYFIYA